MADDSRVGLVLAGGSARGAYEAGVLSILVPWLDRRGERPRILAGASVGAINAASVAATRHLPAEEAVAQGLARWREVDRGAVIRPVISRQLPLTALRYAGEILAVPGAGLSSLLDPTPLRDNLGRWIDWPQLHRNIAAGVVGSLAVVATAARTGRAVAFVEGGLDEAVHRSHVIDYVPAVLEATHVRASAAIPVLFPPVRVQAPAEARGWYVDGGTRLNTPIKPALDLGADRLVVIGTDCVHPPPKDDGRHDAPAPRLGDSALHLLHGSLLDPLGEDLRRLGDVNAFFADGATSPAAQRYREARGKPPYREIPYIFVAPRRPGAIGELAAEVFEARYGGLKALRSLDLVVLRRLLGAGGSTHGELLSYLLFDPDFVEALIGMGRDDAKAWLDAPPGRDAPWQVGPLDAFTARPAEAEAAG